MGKEPPDSLFNDAVVGNLGSDYKGFAKRETDRKPKPPTPISSEQELTEEEEFDGDAVPTIDQDAVAKIQLARPQTRDLKKEVRKKKLAHVATVATMETLEELQLREEVRANLQQAATTAELEALQREQQEELGFLSALGQEIVQAVTDKSKDEDRLKSILGGLYEISSAPTSLELPQAWE